MLTPRKETTTRENIGPTTLVFPTSQESFTMPQQPNHRLSGQSAVVTGSSGGIGAAVALALAREGANVAINYYSDEEGAKKVANKIAEMDAGAKTVIVQADTSDEKDVERLFAKAIDEFGTVDIAVANAGIQKDAPTHEMTLDQWRRVIDVNLTGQFIVCRAAIREFLRRGVREDVSVATGKIICMSSVHDIIPWAGHINYAAAKGGVKLMMETIAQEYGPKGIRANSISPGAIATDINDEVVNDPVKKEALLKLIPYRRVGKPTDIGAVAAWLASDESDYITGETIYVDGGMTNYPGFSENG